MSIIKIHGTSGAGKSTVVRKVMEAGYSPVTIYNDRDKVEGYRFSLPDITYPVYLLGKYTNQCGGMDTISSTADQIALVEKYAPLGHVLYEGLLISTYYGKFGAAMEKYGSLHVWAFLNTPIEICIERIKDRRLAAGNLKPLSESNTRNRVKPIDSLHYKLRQKGAATMILQWDGVPHWQIIKHLGAHDHVYS